MATILKSLGIFSILFVFQSMMISDVILGTWEYDATNTSPEYAKGEIMIAKAGDEYKVTLAVNYSKIEGTQVTVAENQVTFNVNVEGADVAVTLMVAGDNVTGSAQSDEGTYKLTGKRKKAE